MSTRALRRVRPGLYELLEDGRPVGTVRREDLVVWTQIALPGGVPLEVRQHRRVWRRVRDGRLERDLPTLAAHRAELAGGERGRYDRGERLDDGRSPLPGGGPLARTDGPPPSD